MKKILLQLLAIILLLSACDGLRVSEKLRNIDSLVVREQYDSAYVLLDNFDESLMTEDDKAHFYLLSTQLGYLTNNPLPSDSLLDLAIAYYSKVGNNQKLADAYYYKSCKPIIEQNYPDAILICKEAERLAMNTNDDRLKYKIVENLAYLNGLCENNLMQLQYAKKAFTIAEKIHNKNWMAYSYNRISFAFASLNQYDSACIYIEKSIPYYKYINDSDKSAYLANIGLFYKDREPQKAKEYLEIALKYGEHPGIYEHLADIYYSEGEKEKAYALWKNALKTNGRYEKDNILYSILSYDIERGKLDEVCKNIDQIIAIKDSLLYQLRNDTIKDMQMHFDHEVAVLEADNKLMNTQRIVMGLALVLIIMAFYIFFRKKKEEALQREHQLQLYAYTTEIGQLKAIKDEAQTQIKELECDKDKYSEKISDLEEEVNNADNEIKRLNKNIKKLLDDEALKLKRGRMLYDHIIEGGTLSNWSSKEQELFNNYYGAINYQSYNKIRKQKRATKTSAHNMFYLILKEMGKSDDEVRRIMGLSQEGIRTLRNRTKPVEE